METIENLISTLAEGTKSLKQYIGMESATTEEKIDALLSDARKGIEKGRKTFISHGKEMENILSDSIKTAQSQFDALARQVSEKKDDLDVEWAEAKAKISVRIAMEAMWVAQEAVLEFISIKTKKALHIKK